MKNRSIITLFILSIAAPILANDEVVTEERIPVFVSIQPMVYFVERIGGNRVDVDVLVQPGNSPATYSPSPAQMARLAKAKVFFRIGVPFEDALMPKIKNSARDLEIVDTRKGIKLRRMQESHHHHHEGEDEAGQEEGHEIEGSDPHIWLNPLLVKQQARTICEALVELDPEKQSEYTFNLEVFLNDLDALEKEIRLAMAPLRGQTIFVFHPTFGYFADAYGLRQMAVEVEGKSPKARELAMFIKKAKRENVRVIFVQPQFDQSAARKIASAINGVVISMDPLARDYINNLRKWQVRYLKRWGSDEWEWLSEPYYY